MKEKRMKIDIASEMIEACITEQMKDMTEEELRYIFQEVMYIKKARILDSDDYIIGYKKKIIKENEKRI